MATPLSHVLSLCLRNGIPPQVIMFGVTFINVSNYHYNVANPYHSITNIVIWLVLVGDG